VLVGHDVLFDFSSPRHYDSLHDDLIVLDEDLRTLFSYFAHLVLPPFESQPSEAWSGLPALGVLLREVHGLLEQDFLVVALQDAEEAAVAIHHDEAEPVLSHEQAAQVLRVELAVAELGGDIDGPVGFKVDDHLFFALFGHD